MSDLDRFEDRFEAWIQARADIGSRPVDAGAIARDAIIAAGRRRQRPGMLALLPWGRPRASLVRTLIIALLIGLLAGAVLMVGGQFLGPTPPAPMPSWTVVGRMGEARTGHTATLLPDGEVLVAGGGPASAELYDPSTGIWRDTDSMVVARSDHTATRLTDGTVLVAGGTDSTGEPAASAELYDPRTGTWKATASMAVARSGHTATLLSDGRVLVAGGSGTTSAELYDPARGVWSGTGSMARDRIDHTATLLRDGSVLVVGGFDGGLTSAEIYHPATGSWSATADPDGPRSSHTATLLGDGTVLVVGGSSIDGLTGPVEPAQRFDPGIGSWTSAGTMHVIRIDPTATLLADGRVLVVGGSRVAEGDFISERGAELYDPEVGSWALTATTDEGRDRGTATLLSDGRVLVTGGLSSLRVGVALSSAEVYDPGDRR